MIYQHTNTQTPIYTVDESVYVKILDQNRVQLGKIQLAGISGEPESSSEVLARTQSEALRALGRSSLDVDPAAENLFIGSRIYI